MIDNMSHPAPTDVLILNEPFVPDFCRSQRWAARTRARVMRHPDGLATAAAVLRRLEYSVSLVDGPAMAMTPPDVSPLVKKLHPRVVILDSTTPSIASDIATAHRIKNSLSPLPPIVIMVGPHCSALPLETLLAGGGAVDAVAIGEYEITLAEAVEALLKPIETSNGPNWRPGLQYGGATPFDGLTDISGLGLYNRGRPFLTPPRAPADLDSLPFPDWRGLDLMAYRDGVKLYPFMTLSSGRGCPWGCEFCLWPQVMHGRKVRYRSIDSVITEMKRCLDLYPDLKRGEFFFEDDTLTVDRDRTLALGRAIAKELPGTLWSANARADINDLKYLKALKTTGLRMLLTGFESGDQGILDRMGKSLTIEKARGFARAAADAGISVHGCFVLGYPGETGETMERTVRYALSLPIDTAQFSAAVPFPGTRLYDRCLAERLLTDENFGNQHSRSTVPEGKGEQRSTLNLPGLTGRKIDAKVDEALRRFYLRPGWAVRFALKTRSCADLHRKIIGALGLIGYLSNSRPRTFKDCAHSFV